MVALAVAVVAVAVSVDCLCRTFDCTYSHRRWRTPTLANTSSASSALSPPPPLTPTPAPCRNKVLENLSSIDHAPSVQMHQASPPPPAARPPVDGSTCALCAAGAARHVHLRGRRGARSRRAHFRWRCRGGRRARRALAQRPMRIAWWPATMNSTPTTEIKIRCPSLRLAVSVYGLGWWWV